MKDKINLLILFLLLLSINYASSQAFNIHQLTDFECSPAHGLYKFKIQAKNITTEQKLTPFYIYLNDTGSELPPYRAICNLDDEELLKKIALSEDEPEETSFTCYMEDVPEEKTIELQISGVNDLNLKPLPLDIYGGLKNTISFTKCEKKEDEYYSSIINKKIYLRQVSHYEPSAEEKQIKFLLSAITSQTLPENYGIPVKISMSTVDPLVDLNSGKVEIPQIDYRTSITEKGEVIIECELQEKLKDCKLMIGQFSVLDGYKEIFRLNKIATDNEVTVGNGKEIRINKMFNNSLSFGQVNGFKAENEEISFIFIGFITEELKDTNISIVVNLIKHENLVEEEALCTTIEENVKPKDGEQLKVQFECKIENIVNSTDYTGLEIISSEDVIGIPTEPELLNPAIVDELIEAEEVQNYTLLEEIEISVFNATSIDTIDSRKKGVFYILGEFLTEFTLEKRFEFEIILLTGEKALCTLPKLDKKGEVKIECELQEKLKDTKIMIEQFSALDGFKEIFRLNKISTDNEVTVSNGKEIRIEKMFNNSLSFGQVNGFKTEEKQISFSFFGFISEELKKDTEISMIVNLIKGEELIEEEAICISTEDLEPEEGKQVPIEFSCKVENIDKPEEFTGLEVVTSTDIIGIPTEPELINPAIVDKLIEEGEIRDYSIEENKNQTESIPEFNATSIDTSSARTKGIFTIEGNLLSEIELEEDFTFEIILLTGEKAICTLPVIENIDNVQIECELQEELKDSKIMIEQSLALDGFKELFKINKISTDKKVSVANGKKKKLEKKFNSNLSFRQTNTFKFDKPKKMASFVIEAFTTEPMEKDNEIIIDVNLLLTAETKKKEAKCKNTKKITIPETSLQIPVSLKCQVEEIELGENIDCIGLEMIESEVITNIPKDKKLCNPKKVDKLIGKGEIKQAKESDIIPEFNATSIDTTGSMSNGIFSIEGILLNDIEKEFIFNITLVSGEMALCNLPKVEKGKMVKIECVLDGTIEQSKIMIPQTTILSDYKELFTINKISTEREVSCANGKLKKMHKKLDNKISFRQVSNFKPLDKKISFIFSAFILDNMKKRKEINMDINLEMENNQFTSEIAKCILNKEVSGATKENPIPSDFECSVENIENGDKVEGLELISCDEISGIPSDLNMTNPIVVDKLIESGEVIDYSLPENINNIPPVFKASSLNSLGCKSSGVFKLKGIFNKFINHFRFNLPLSYPVIDTRCDVPESKEGEEVEVICKTKNTFSSSKIIIEPSTINKNNSEVISLLPISSDGEVSCEDFSKVYNKKMEKKYRAPFSFRQTQKFKNTKGKIDFSIFCAKTEHFNNEKEITVKGRLIKNIRLRNLEEEISSPIDIDCTAKTIQTDPVEFGCSLIGDPDTNGIIIFDSEELSGIPDNKLLTNPANVDNLILAGKEKDCYSRLFFTYI